MELHGAFTHSVEAVIDEMFQVFAHADLSHQLVLVAVHARQLSHVSKDILQPVGQLQDKETHSSKGTLCQMIKQAKSNRPIAGLYKGMSTF